ncbi:MAG: phosphotransferase [Gammaproteobacteria bacterium]|nr:phosphotransferase [Gammaproteobacteria bacterium]
MMRIELATENHDSNKKIIRWGCDYLLSHHYKLISEQPEEVQNTPWSYVVRFKTSVGYIYLKHTPQLLALEASITQILRDQFHSPVPEIIANNTALNCFLMRDNGTSLRTILKKQFNTALLCKAINQFTIMQLAVADHASIFFDVGVPDWRLDKLPDLFMQLLLQKYILMADGLSEIEINKLEKLRPIIFNLCEKLSMCAIKQTLVQCDFHDNNILIDDKTHGITHIDLGEIVISHPFFSLVGCLKQMKKHYALTKQDDRYLQLMDACLENYLPFESKSRLLEAFVHAEILWIIYEALAQYRLMMACDKTRFLSFQRHGRLSGALKAFMAACCAIDSGER